MTEHKTGDVVSLQYPITFGAMYANGKPIEGVTFVTNVVVILAITGPDDEGDTAFVAPAAMFDTALLKGAAPLYPQPVRQENHD